MNRRRIRPSRKRTKIIIVFVVLLLAVGCFLYYERGRVTTDDAQLAAVNIAIAPKTQGYVKKLNITDNQIVQKGDVLLEIDDKDYKIALSKAAATVQAAKAAAATASENLKTTQITAPSNAIAVAAQLASAEARWADSAASRQRMTELFKSEVIARQQYDDAIAAEEYDRALVAQMKANLQAQNSAPNLIEAAQNNYDQALAQVKQAEAELAKAEEDLANTKVIALIDGRITNRSVDSGDYVQVGQQLGSIVGNELWVVANFKETQISNMKIGQEVDVVVDAYPDIKLRGRIDSFQEGTGAFFSLFPPQNATGNFVKTVQRVPVKITFDNPPTVSMHIGPGMSVSPVVLVN